MVGDFSLHVRDTYIRAATLLSQENVDCIFVHLIKHLFVYVYMYIYIYLYVSLPPPPGSYRQRCYVFCTDKGATFMGLEYGIQCSCGFGEQGLYTGLGEGQCGYECYGDGSENCGKPSADPDEQVFRVCLV